MNSNTPLDSPSSSVELNKNQDEIPSISEVTELYTEVSDSIESLEESLQQITLTEDEKEQIAFIRDKILKKVEEKKAQKNVKSIFYEKLLISLCNLFTGLKASFVEPLVNGPCIFYANHQSHLDGLALWSSLPKERRIETHPIAAKSYWQGSALKEFIANDIFNALLIDREKETRNVDPIMLMASLLEVKQSLIIFPEGTRGQGEVIQPFKSGLYHLAKTSPDIPIIPVYLHNLHRVMPKGSKLIVPILCDVRFGKAIAPLGEVEEKSEFLSRAQHALEELKNAI
ncbi:lysophospholipid acyltransferase family protein [Thorsellia kenyensis]|uniref:Lysophospholipid acyltransferase family protein n=1 Tax=Thorsellia kenyensis TaxID=1549888 RepID=A0ABV6CBI1_9GAMM